jgi:two-component system, cell cycle response regulator
MPARPAAVEPPAPAHTPAQDTSPAATPFSAPPAPPARPIFGVPTPAKPPAVFGTVAAPADGPRYKPSFERTEAAPMDVDKPASNTAPPSFRSSRGGLLSFANSEAPNDAVATKVQTTTAANDDDDLILVVDDSDIVLRFMQGRLQRFGYAVELANTGEEAIQMCEKRFYKFIFLDVMMPGIDGYQTCRMVKKQKHGDKGAPVVVMLSSRGGSIDKIRGTLAGADAYLTKPLLEAALIKVLADHDQQTQNNFSATRPVSGLGTMR